MVTASRPARYITTVRKMRFFAKNSASSLGPLISERILGASHRIPATAIKES